MIIYKIVGEINSSEGIAMSVREIEAIETKKSYRTTSEIIPFRKLLKPEGMWPRVASFARKKDIPQARELIMKVLLNMYDEKRRELDDIKNALRKSDKSPEGKNLVDMKPEVSEFIEKNSTALYEGDEPTYFFLPYWYEKLAENMYRAYSLDNIPDKLKKKMLEWQEFAESNPELKVGL